MSDLLLEQYTRLLDKLPHEDPWPALEESGFLDLLQSEEKCGAELMLEDLFPLVLETGSRITAPPIIETMVARLLAADATNINDVEHALVGHPAARPLAAAIAAAQMAGAMKQVQAMTVEYATTRRQFGREIGRFQAIQHHIAVLAEETMTCRMAAQAAFFGPPLQISERRAAVAKCRAGQAARIVCSVAHAVHGAIGISLEHSLNYYTRRLHHLALAHGGESWWSRRLGLWALTQSEDFTTLARTV